MIPIFCDLTRVTESGYADLGMVGVNLSLIRHFSTVQEADPEKPSTMLVFGSNDVLFVRESVNYLRNLIATATEQM